MHVTQINILKSLQQNKSQKFAELLKEVAETSDNLTYHLRQLQKADFVESPLKGQYSLAQKGLIYLNNNLELGQELFPTLSCMLELHGPGGTVLVMRKRKQPYLNSLHLPTFGITSSMALQDQVDDFLRHYHIAGNDLVFKGLPRERAGDSDGVLTFDKFFVLFIGTLASFEQNIEDREFMRAKVADLAKDAQLLHASKTVLALDAVPNFTESMHNRAL